MDSLLWKSRDFYRMEGKGKKKKESGKIREREGKRYQKD